MTDKGEHYKRYGWACSEANLATLPPSAPEAAKDLAKWLTLNGREKMLIQWLEALKEDGRVHGKFWPIGAWTHRMSHSSPNQANIPSVFPEGKEPSGAVEEVKKQYDGEMRSCFVADEGCWLVGTDAAGIQLRVLAHYMKSEEYRKAIVSGNKDDGTDIHNLNKNALGPVCDTRDSAKTFIYAWLLGASLPKIAEILKSTTAQARTAERNFLDSLPELKRLKEHEVKRDASRGYFIGLDGRKVVCSSQHHMLSGYLQNGEAVIMKRAALLWTEWAREIGIDFKLVNFVHDEWQTEVRGSRKDAERIGNLQRMAIEQVGQDLKLFCPLEGETNIGRDWKETH